MPNSEKPRLVWLTADIVAAYVRHNTAMANELPALIRMVHLSLQSLVAPVRPKVPVRSSIADDYLSCLEDGWKFKSLNRHLKAEYDITPEDYRAKWGLASSYPWLRRPMPPRDRPWPSASAWCERHDCARSGPA